MIIVSNFQNAFFVAIFALLGVVLIGSLRTTLHLNRWHPNLISAVIGALLGFALIEAVPLLT
jgi:hypothetical protein